MLEEGVKWIIRRAHRFGVGAKGAEGTNAGGHGLFVLDTCGIQEKAASSLGVLELDQAELRG
jgi:hypothetical protein